MIFQQLVMATMKLIYAEIAIYRMIILILNVQERIHAQTAAIAYLDMLETIITNVLN